MSCVPAFEKNLNFDCVKEIVLDARNGKVDMETVKKGLWVLGCGAEFFAPQPLIGDLQEKSIEQLCDDLDGAMTFGAEDDTAKNPMVWISVAQLVWQMIQLLRKK